MSKIITVCRLNSNGFQRAVFQRIRKKTFNRQKWHLTTQKFKEQESQKGSIKLGFMHSFFALITTMVIFGAFYLFQVNSLVSMGYEVNNMQNKIQELQKTKEQNRIKEVELKSMYRIEKTTQNLNLINTTNISYLEINERVAMK